MHVSMPRTVSLSSYQKELSSEQPLQQSSPGHAKANEAAKTHESAASVFSKIQPASGLPEEEKGSHPPSIPEKIVSKYRGMGRTGQMVLSMMRESLQLPPDPQDAILEIPVMETETVVLKREQPRLIEVDTIDAVVLGLLFPVQGNNIPRVFYRLDEFAEVEIEAVTASPEQIADLPLSKEEQQGVKRLKLFRSSVTDEQLIALTHKFPYLEEIHLSLCLELSNRGIEAFSNLKALRSISLLFCPKVNHNLLSLVLPIENLEEFGLSTKGPIDAAFVERLAASRKLKRVSFNLCPQFAPQTLFCFKEAHRDGPIEISAKGCDQIDTSIAMQLNADRRENPIAVQIGLADQADLSVHGLPRMSAAAPVFPNQPDTLSRQSIHTIFPDTHPEALPHPSVINDSDLSQHQFKTIYLSSDVPGERINESMIALIDRCPQIETICISNSKQISHSGIIHLRQLHLAKTLYLSHLTQVTANMLKTMLISNINEKTWQRLEVASFSELPISDEALALMAELPNLRQLTLSNCNEFTVQGLYHLMLGCKELEQLTLRNCPSIDLFAIEEFQVFRPKVKFNVESVPDPSLDRIAREETERRLFDPLAINHYTFLPDLLNEKEPIPLGRKIDLEPAQGIQFYRELFKKFGIEFSIDPTNLEKEWIRLDLTLQSHLNLSRTAWAYRKELVRLGFFTNVDPAKAPDTVAEIVRLMRIRNSKGECPYVKKLKIIDLKNLGVSFIPYFILDEPQFPQLTQIQLRGTDILDVPIKFKERMPQLEVIEYSDGRVEGLEAFSDESIERMDDLQRFSELQVKNSEQFTLQGLNLLMDRSPRLRTVTLIHCLGIDLFAIDEIVLKRPHLKFEVTAGPNDKILGSLSIQEARKRMGDPHGRCFIFHQAYTESSNPIPETSKFVFNTTIALEFYKKRFAQMGIDYEIDHTKDPIVECMFCDQILQSYVNIFRTTMAICKVLFLRNSFNDLNEETYARIQKLRKTPLGIIELLQTRDEFGRPIADRIQTLDFSNLGITNIPSILLYGFEWRAVRSIHLSQTHVLQLPDDFIRNCQNLKTIIFPDRTEQFDPSEGPSGALAPPPPPPAKKRGKFPFFTSWTSKKTRM